MSEARPTGDGEASRVVMSYRAIGAGDGEWVLADSDWIRERMREDSYIGFLRKVHAGPVAVGDEFEEFVNCGCASPQDVIVRIEAVEGGDALGPGTEIEILPRRDVVAD